MREPQLCSPRLWATDPKRQPRYLPLPASASSRGQDRKGPVVSVSANRHGSRFFDPERFLFSFTHPDRFHLIGVIKTRSEIAPNVFLLSKRITNEGNLHELSHLEGQKHEVLILLTSVKIISHPFIL